MNKKKASILFLDFTLRPENIIKQIIAQGDYALHYINSADGDIHDKIKGIDCDLSIISVSSQSLDESITWERISDINRRYGLTPVLISSIINHDHYLNGLKSGVYSYINTPCSKKHILSSIDELIEINKSDKKGVPIEFKFDYMNKSHTISTVSYTHLRAHET